MIFGVLFYSFCIFHVKCLTFFFFLGGGGGGECPGALPLPTDAHVVVCFFVLFLIIIIILISLIRPLFIHVALDLHKLCPVHLFVTYWAPIVYILPLLTSVPLEPTV